ncbi:4'-phosphopantetheinyl transferase superfamily protein [Pseudoalteromonas sp. MMG007]|uniref:4'-phosphopantetheinyl transferase family protein n=1 Tax=Pseudoalteromonas sp. MMG007 TaxID=2822684 RepID=UPI001B360180|nr:4'-phosphopantetheinyl transferase superfamily protein [Pseudoalteromonas sp. MMG007]MBQ4859997.1 4'-phosphopantetheinyl transferase superfamily protein [Pseudoalteromonas sp. MMG007]
MFEPNWLLITQRAQDSFVLQCSVWRTEQPDLIISGVQFSAERFTQSLFQEYAIVQNINLDQAVIKRKAEYLAGRYCAKQALKQHFGENQAICDIPSGKHREPIWPTGVLGSITHTNTYALCAIGDIESLNGIGIDMEEILETNNAKELAQQIHDQQELKLLTLNNIPINFSTTLIFSAKESIFKALYNNVSGYFGFEVARLSKVDTARQSLTFCLDKNFCDKYRLVSHVDCTYFLFENKVLTLCVI